MLPISVCLQGLRRLIVIKLGLAHHFTVEGHIFEDILLLPAFKGMHAYASYICRKNKLQTGNNFSFSQI